MPACSAHLGMSWQQQQQKNDRQLVAPRQVPRQNLATLGGAWAHRRMDERIAAAKLFLCALYKILPFVNRILAMRFDNYLRPG